MLLLDRLLTQRECLSDLMLRHSERAVKLQESLTVLVDHPCSIVRFEDIVSIVMTVLCVDLPDSTFIQSEQFLHIMLPDVVRSKVIPLDVQTLMVLLQLVVDEHVKCFIHLDSVFLLKVFCQFRELTDVQVLPNSYDHL